MGKTNKLKILAFARFQAFLAALLGLLLGFIYSFGGLIIDTMVTLGLLSTSSASTLGLSIGTIYAFGALIGMPMICGVAGFISGIIESILYNLYAKKFGGVIIDFFN